MKKKTKPVEEEVLVCKPESVEEEEEWAEDRENSNEGRFDKSTKRLIKIFVMLLLIFIVILALRMFYKPAVEKEQAYMYNGFEFRNVSGSWNTKIQRNNTDWVYNIPLRYGPRDLETIPINAYPKVFSNYTSIFVTFDPTERELGYTALAAAELTINMAQVLDITPVAACIKNETNACLTRPIVECNSTQLPTIFIKISEEPKVTIKDNCITVEGKGESLMKAIDRLLLTWFEVMKI